MPWLRGHTLSIFSALCLSQRNQGSSGALTQLASLPRPPFPLPSSPPPPPLSVCHILTPALALPLTAMSSSVSILLQCHFLPPLIHSICPSVSPSLLSVSLPLSPDEISGPLQELQRKVPVWASFFLHISCVCACVLKERSEGWIEVSSSQREINIHMVLPGLKRMWLLTSHKNFCSNI